VWNQPLKRPYGECDAWRERTLELVAEEEPELVLVAMADMYDVVDEAGTVVESRADAAWDAAMESYLDRLAGRAARVVVLADTPRTGYLAAECLATHAAIDGCDAQRARMVDEDYRDREARVAQRAGVAIISATDWLCSSSDCPLVRGSTLVYRDGHHLTATYAAKLAGRLGAALDARSAASITRP